MDAFVVAGGGGGGADGGGGGGGGGMQPRAGIAVTPGDSITIRIGAGGTPGIWGGGAGSAGGVSSISSNSTTLVTANGGSAGTSGPNQAFGAGGTSTNGYAGGAGGTSSTGGGTYGGTGKAGGVNYFLGSAAYYGGGGAGGMYDSTVANGAVLGCTTGGTAGGTGGGATAGVRSGSSHSVGCDAAANTGGGGGAGVAGGTQTSGGNGGSGIAMIRYATDQLNAFPADISGLWARYVADDFQITDSSRAAWVDSSSNGRPSTAVGGLPAVMTATGNGATTSFRTVWGVTAQNLTFASHSSPYTMFGLSRYNGASKRRIFTSTSGNWLTGQYEGTAGVAYHNGWLTSGTAPASPTGWLLTTDQNNLYRANGKTAALTANAQSLSVPLTINTWSSELSDWQAPEVILFNRELTASEIRRVESYLARRYGLQGLTSSEVVAGVMGVGALTFAKQGTVSTGQADRLTASWTLPSDNTGVSDFTVEYKQSTDSTWTTWAHTASSSLTSATITGLTAGTQYDVRVTPVDSGATNRPAQSVTQVATWLASTTALGSLPASPRAGTTYSITATVTSGTTGTVNFKNGGTSITGCSAVTLLSGTATCSWTPSAAGSASITADYGGDSVYLVSSTVSASSVTVLNAICSPSSATSGRYTVHRMLTAQTCDYTSLPSGVESVDVFVVGGGGGAGENVGNGGGGGGAYYAERVVATSASTLTVTVGNGGRAGTYPTDTTSASTQRDGGNGEASSIAWSTNTFTGNGGTGGQTHWADNKCGGVGRDATVATGGSGSGTGGTASTGGAGGLSGADININASTGSAGFSNSITGTATNYGGGGGGGAWGTGTGAAGGAGGGGAGTNSTTANAGTANTGGGGGGTGAGCAAGAAGGSGIAIVRYANVPTITTQPTGASKNAAQSYTFSVTPSATGAVAGDFSYQWRKGGVNISGATSSTLVFSSLTVADAGTYSVVVKNSGSSGAVSSVTSADAVLTVNQATQSITFGTLADRVYGVAPITVSATASSGLTVSFASTTTSVCTVSGTTVTVINTGTCTITASQAGSVDYLAATDVSQSFTVTTKTLTITGMTAANREYDRSVNATPSFTGASLVGVVGSDTVTIDSSGATATFADKIVGTSKTVTAAGVLLGGAQASRYTVTQPTATANITAKALTITGVTASNRVYDSTTAATALLNKGSATLSGVVSGDTVTLSTTGATATFASKTVGTGKTVTIIGNTISGADSANYTLTQPTTTADITAKELTVTGITANNKTYDASTSATSLLVKSSAALVGIQGSDTVALSTASATATFATKTIGAGKTVTIAGLSISGTDYTNYTLTQPTTTASILAKELTVTGITASSRVYDATVSATSLLNKGGATIVGVQGTDDVTLVTLSATATFATKAIGTAKTVFVADLSVSGTDIGNYTLTQPTTTA
ncbi:MAG: YDG domain-containing protein, partial [Actinomycetes bacterium]